MKDTIAKCQHDQKEKATSIDETSNGRGPHGTPTQMPEARNDSRSGRKTDRERNGNAMTSTRGSKKRGVEVAPTATAPRKTSGNSKSASNHVTRTTSVNVANETGSGLRFRDGKRHKARKRGSTVFIADAIKRQTMARV